MKIPMSCDERREPHRGSLDAVRDSFALIDAGSYGPLAVMGPSAFAEPTSQMREIMRERGDFLFAQGVGDVGHRRPGAAGSHARFVVMQRLDQIFLALAGEPRHRLRSRIAVGVA